MAQGRGTHETFDYVPFSDANILGELIRNRMSLDKAYKERVYPNDPLSASCCPEFNESIITVYIDLDMLIESAPLTSRQRALLELFMRGYAVQDICEETGMRAPNVCKMFTRAVQCLVEHHNLKWLKTYTGKESWYY